MLATKEYDEGTPRTIRAATLHVLKSLGISGGEIDREALQNLEDTYWTPHGELFDYSAENSGQSALDTLKLVAQAGMGYFLLSDSRASAGREGIKSWAGAISPQRMTQELTTAFVSPGPDDFDGVDVSYIDEVTWSA